MAARRVAGLAGAGVVAMLAALVLPVTTAGPATAASRAAPGVAGRAENGGVGAATLVLAFLVGLLGLLVVFAVLTLRSERRSVARAAVKVLVLSMAARFREVRAHDDARRLPKAELRRRCVDAWLDLGSVVSGGPSSYDLAEEAAYEEAAARTTREQHEIAVAERATAQARAAARHRRSREHAEELAARDRLRREAAALLGPVEPAAAVWDVAPDAAPVTVLAEAERVLRSERLAIERAVERRVEAERLAAEAVERAERERAAAAAAEEVRGVAERAAAEAEERAEREREGAGAASEARQAAEMMARAAAAEAARERMVAEAAVARRLAAEAQAVEAEVAQSAAVHRELAALQAAEAASEAHRQAVARLEAHQTAMDRAAATIDLRDPEAPRVVEASSPEPAGTEPAAPARDAIPAAEDVTRTTAKALPAIESPPGRRRIVTPIDIGRRDLGTPLAEPSVVRQVLTELMSVEAAASAAPVALEPTAVSEPTVVTESEILESAVVEPEVAPEPRTVEPAVVTEPDVVGPAALESAVVQPVVLEPAVAEPVVVEPVVVEPVVVEPAALQPTAAEPVVVEPVVAPIVVESVAEPMVVAPIVVESVAEPMVAEPMLAAEPAAPQPALQEPPWPVVVQPGIVEPQERAREEDRGPWWADGTRLAVVLCRALALAVLPAALIARTVLDGSWWSGLETADAAALGMAVALAALGARWLWVATIPPFALLRRTAREIRGMEARQRRQTIDAAELLDRLATGPADESAWAEFENRTGFVVPGTTRSVVDAGMDPAALVRYLADRQFPRSSSPRPLSVVVAVPVITCILPAAALILAI